MTLDPSLSGCAGAREAVLARIRSSALEAGPDPGDVELVAVSKQQPAHRVEAMLAAGHARVRPVLMTATAMILGMVPMALGMGEGGEQNAPLGRAVIGGLLFATVTTLFVVPIVYTYLRKQPPVDAQHRLDEWNRSGQTR